MRVPSSADHSTSSTRLRARVTEEAIISSTFSGSIWSLYFMWMGEVEMKVWMRGLRGVAHRLGAAVDVLAAARARPAMVAFFTRWAISSTDSKSPWLAIGKAGLDDVDAQLVQQVGDLELLLEGHGGAGRLLAVAQGGVENDDAIGVGCVRGLVGHDVSS